MAFYRRERIIAGLILGLSIPGMGFFLISHAYALSVTVENGRIISPDGTMESYQHAGLMLIAFGLVLLAITFHHWLSPNSMSAEQA